MHKFSSAIIRIFLLSALMAMAGCNLMTEGLHVSTPTSNVLISTVAAAQTEAVQSVYKTLTQAAALTPSATLPPLTATSQPTIEKSKTQIASTATKKITATKKPAPSPTSNAYKCFITSLSPTSGTSITKGKNFDLKVTFRNDGTETWKPTTVDFIYLSGPKFQKTSNVIRLKEDVIPGQSVKLLVDMAATSAKGTQNINWALEQGTGVFFCYVGITVTIK